MVPKYIHNLCTFGEIEVINEGIDKIRRKLENKGSEVMFVVYRDDHPQITLHFQFILKESHIFH